MNNTTVKMEKFQWINPDHHSIAVDDQKQPVLNENGDLIVLDNESGKCIAVPNSDDVLEIFGFGYSTGYGSPSGSPKDSPDRDLKPIVQVVTDADTLLWSMRTPCQKDIEATREMLALVASKKYQDMFNDQCTVKIRVWKRICEELMNKGYRIADSVNEGGIKCHQKWRNLEKSYRNYLISSTDLNSSAPKKPPPYFEALHEILKKKKKYANAASYSYSQTVVVGDEMIGDPDASGGHLNDTDVMDDMDDMDGQNDDHCYVVNSSGHVSKRLKMDPLAVCSTSGGSGSGGGGGGAGNSSGPRVKHQQPDVLEQILEQMVRVHRDTMAMQERHFNRLERLMKENAIQSKRLADVLGRLTHNRDDKQHDKSAATNSDVE
ncbi:uncharacterized protein LOC126833484 [Adelges cooleyi]|uniref:uncharacterized protein LOC126833484 n=1 Tax=Adelges cooleyi TaxID=133065 RepID=UPI0021801CE4|nr:uncharacterized protein LOC126833484 [Adelges cooleyi]XP_050420812.1 uncharacterized protein LOC126833484 [Adelges cooleyi]XP_050420813.1 uncharacterized protein LOC126833484 [Adelges cooleyi]XP_050420814.1 uncharacterized protein LOC126833484 [Adelges cooleyi]XP_050420815.1 uncharacterized protein LOC126833484 [Adelges cooleyi]XP_050420816.1 uncharacterized protein LOC126833484 [Adelges cooleyi]